MARLPRLSIAACLHHVIQRGNNGQPIFVEPADYAWMLNLIHEQARNCDVSVHAYVLMGNHFHLLLTPHSDASLPKMMQSVGRAYVRYFNDRYGRTGTLWEGRYRSTILQPERYLLSCMAFIDLNPVRALVAENPLDYPWSSHGHYVGSRADRVLAPHALYWGLGNTPFAREAAYAELVRRGLDAAVDKALTDSSLRGWALGDAPFIQALQERTSRRVSRRLAGRPAKAARLG